MNNRPLCVVLGAGEGLGVSLALEFDKHGYQVVGLNRSQVKSPIDDIVMMQLDAGDHEAVDVVFKKVVERYGVPEVFIHNTAQLYIKTFEETSSEHFTMAWQSMVLSAFNVMKLVVPMMAQQNKGTVIVSGATASLRAGANFSAFASAKFALRGLVQSVAREYQKQGVHIAHVVLDGILDTPASRVLHSLDPSDMMSTQEVAEAYMQIVQQKPSAWTHELDLRPKNESF